MNRRSKSYLTLVGAVVFVLVLGINVSACFHAKAMVTFSSTESKTQRPEQLTISKKIGVLLSGVNVPRPENLATPADFGLDFEIHSYPNTRGDTIEAWHIAEHRSATLVLLFHSYAASKQSLLVAAQEFKSLGYSTLLVDFYGSGGSSGNGTTVGILEADDVGASVAYARSRWPDSRLVLYGSSMGGAAILRAVAVHEVRPDAIVLEGVFDRMVNTVRHRFRAMGLPSTPFAELLVFWGGQRAGFDGFEHNPAVYAQSVNFPALILHGQNDRRVTISEAKSIFAEMSGWKRLSEYTEAEHHDLLLEANPTQWREDVLEILAVVDAVGLTNN
jgi:hypothetical protein